MSNPNEDDSIASPGSFLRASLESCAMPGAQQELPRVNKFLEGFQRFHNAYFRENKELFSKLKDAQTPKTLIVGCCDSRVDPAILTDAEPGDMFIVRNVANLVPPYQKDHTNGLHGVSAAIEFAVNFLQVEDIIVLGHVKCGGIAALMGNTQVGEFITPWMSIAKRARENVIRKFADSPKEIQHRACEHAAILVSLENLVGYPWVRERLQKKTLTINGWYFDFEAGELQVYDPCTGGFEVSRAPGGSLSSLAQPTPPAGAQQQQTASSAPISTKLHPSDDPRAAENTGGKLPTAQAAGNAAGKQPGI